MYPDVVTLLPWQRGTLFNPIKRFFFLAGHDDWNNQWHRFVRLKPVTALTGLTAVEAEKKWLSPLCPLGEFLPARRWSPTCFVCVMGSFLLRSFVSELMQGHKTVAKICRFSLLLSLLCISNMLIVCQGLDLDATELLVSHNTYRCM